MNPDTKPLPNTKILYVDKSKIRKTLSNITFHEVIVYQAYTDNQEDRVPYYSQSYVNDLLKQIQELKGN